MIAVFRRKNNVLIFKLLLLILSLEFTASNKLKLKNFSFELPYHLIQMILTQMFWGYKFISLVHLV